MNAMEYVMLGWVLPSLLTALAMMGAGRTLGDTPADQKMPDWGFLLFGSILYPIGIVCLISVVVVPWLVKERTFIWRS